MRIEELVVELSKDPFNPKKNFDVAVEYEKQNQTASAVSFYLRTAEYGGDTDSLLIYTSLLKMAACFEDQNDRVFTVSNCLLQAITVLPTRPEAYFLLAKFHEKKGDWQECYTWATVGLSNLTNDEPPLPALVGYKGPYCLNFEKAVSAWWIGRPQESKDLLLELSKIEYMDDEYKVAVKNNRDRLGI